MRRLVSSKFRALLAAAVVLVCLSPGCFADTISLTSSPLSSTLLGPSSDTLSLKAGSTTLNSTSGHTTFQTGDFIVGDSEISDQIIPFSFQDSITLNGITQILTFFGQDSVTNAADTLSIFAGTPTVFGNEVFTLQSFSATGTAIGQDLPVDLQTSVAPAPEPATLLLLLTGILAVLVLAPGMRRSLGSSTASVAPTIDFIKMPVPARSWVQRGAAFHSATAETAQPQPAPSEIAGPDAAATK